MLLSFFPNLVIDQSRYRKLNCLAKVNFIDVVDIGVAVNNLIALICRVDLYLSYSGWRPTFTFFITGFYFIIIPVGHVFCRVMFIGKIR